MMPDLGTFAALVAAVFSVLATIIAGAQLRLQWRSDRQQNEEDRLRRAAAPRAELQAGFTGFRALCVRNSGDGHAGAVRILVDGIPVERSPRVQCPRTPPEYLAAGASFEMPTVQATASSGALCVLMTWQDGAGAHEREVSLVVPA